MTKPEAGGYCVYVAYNADDVCLYVGRTGLGDRRLRQHAKTKEWWPRVSRVEVFHTASKEEAALREYELLRRLQPECNVDVPTLLRSPDWWTQEMRDAFMERNPLVR